jgi:hypothetical protein
MKHCKDCEPAQEIHILAYLSVVFGWFDQPLFDLMELLFKNTAEAISKKISLPFFRLMVRLKLGYFTDEPDKKRFLAHKMFLGRGQKSRNQNARISLGADTGRIYSRI